LATWQESTPRRVIFADSAEFSPLHAAVPTVGGWLVIQL
jgi:hypothetical protein